MKNIELIHEPNHSLFILEINTVFSGKIEYNKKGKTLLLNHSEIPPSLRHQGIGKILVDETIAAIQQLGYSYEAQCSYIKYRLSQQNKQS
ncbi:hypothetical protein GCM10007049_14000 [Echinicola pacifica]|uniref:N-acetyltransferase domain-containing protein n=1 Tax=Echinicola pacifica TaxID=346377 RepID=A0A918PVL9_9BACT|nr:N-acetyltransferase [Echinicola pacifica]GGZ22388.1 hypothetical protein GCM10007049_14000 [Echinicola pacifica]